MSTEIWGTFAVDDHLRPRPFVTEALIFDRVVIPDAARMGAVRFGGLACKMAPRTPQTALGTLGSRTILKPWNVERREKWKRRLSELDSQFSARQPARG